MSSATSSRLTTPPGVSARCSPTRSDAALDHRRHAAVRRHVGGPVARSADETRPAGVQETLERRRVADEEVRRSGGAGEDARAGSAPWRRARQSSSSMAVHDDVHGPAPGQVGLEQAPVAEVPGPGRVAEPVVAPVRCELGAAEADPDELRTERHAGAGGRAAPDQRSLQRAHRPEELRDAGAVDPAEPKTASSPSARRT